MNEDWLYRNTALEYAFGGIAVFGTFVIFHLVVARIMKDPTNIEFGGSLVVALITDSLIPDRIWVLGISLSSNFLLMAFVGASILINWKLASVFFDLDRWEGLIAGITAPATFIAIRFGTEWGWRSFFDVN